MFNFPQKGKQSRLSISLPAELVDWVRKTAQENNTTISAVNAYALKKMQAEIIRMKAQQGVIEDMNDPELDAEMQAWMNAPMGRKV